MMAGLAMNISDCTAEHSLGQAIGGVAHVPHGLTIGLVLAETLDLARTIASFPGRATRQIKHLMLQARGPGVSDDSH